MARYMDANLYEEPMDVNYEEYSDDPAVKEIDLLTQELDSFGFSFKDVSDTSPKKEKEQWKCEDALQVLTEDDKLMQLMFKKGYLPVKTLAKYSKIPQKLLEAHEGYIVAAALIMTGNYPILQSFLRYSEEV